LTLALDGGEWSLSCIGRFSPSVLIGLEAVEQKKSLTAARNRTLAVHSIAIPGELVGKYFLFHIFFQCLPVIGLSAIIK
jgi:hypothetical protein